jgi:hypothetical protein
MHTSPGLAPVGSCTRTMAWMISGMWVRSASMAAVAGPSEVVVFAVQADDGPLAGLGDVIGGPQGETSERAFLQYITEDISPAGYTSPHWVVF